MIMTSLPQLPPEPVSHQHDELIDQLFPPTFPGISLSPAPESSPMPATTASLPYPSSPVSFMSISQPLEMLPSSTCQQESSFWQESNVFALPQTFPPPMWLPIPSTTHQLSASVPASAFDMSMPAPTAREEGRTERSLSFASAVSHPTTVSSPEPSPREFSRGSSPGHADLTTFGFQTSDGTWACGYPGCTSKSVFTRGCDLRKHYRRHSKTFFCRYPGCSSGAGGGFSSKKDLARHEAKHNPSVVCSYAGCDRVFSRVDNMRDHVKRIHLKNQRLSGKPGSV